MLTALGSALPAVLLVAVGQCSDMSSVDIVDIIWPWITWAITPESSSTEHFHFSISSLRALLTFCIFFYSNSFSVSHFKQSIYKYTNTAKLCCQRSGDCLHPRGVHPGSFATLEYCKSEIHLCWKQTRRTHANQRGGTTWTLCHRLSREAQPADSIL